MFNIRYQACTMGNCRLDKQMGVIGPWPDSPVDIHVERGCQSPLLSELISSAILVNVHMTWWMLMEMQRVMQVASYQSAHAFDGCRQDDICTFPFQLTHVRYNQIGLGVWQHTLGQLRSVRPLCTCPETEGERTVLCGRQVLMLYTILRPLCLILRVLVFDALHLRHPNEQLMACAGYRSTRHSVFLMTNPLFSFRK